MALQWQWDAQSGTLQHDGKIYKFYEGNAFMIFLYEYKGKETGEDMYDIPFSFLDKMHAKESLGLKKGYIDMFEGNVEKITIYKDNCQNWKDIVELFTKSQKDVVITIYQHKPEEVEE